MKKIWNFLELKELDPSLVNLLIQTVEKNSLKSWIGDEPAERFKMRSDTRMVLDDFFHPFNRKLASLTGDSDMTW